MVSTTDTQTGNRIETATIEEQGGTAVTKTKRIHKTYAQWNQEELYQEIADPDGSAFTTTYDYYTTAGASLGRLKSVKGPTGSWVLYTHDEGNYSWGDLAAVYSPWQGAPSDPSSANSLVTSFTYTSWGSISGAGDVFSDMLLTSSLTKAPGASASVTVAKSTQSYATPADAPHGRPLATVTTQSYASASSSTPPLTSTRTTYRDTAREDYRFRLFAATNPDGTKVSAFRYRAFWWYGGDSNDTNLRKYTGDSNRDTTLGEYRFSGFTSHVQDSVPVNSWDGESFETVYMVPNRSTVDLAIFGADGNVGFSVHYVFTGAVNGVASFEFLSMHETVYINGIAAIQKDSNGQADYLAYIGTRLSGHTFNDGTYVEYFPDSLGRDIIDTKFDLSADSDGIYPAQARLFNYKTFDAAGRVLTEKVSSSFYDAAANPATRSRLPVNLIWPAC